MSAAVLLGFPGCESDAPSLAPGQPVGESGDKRSPIGPSIRWAKIIPTRFARNVLLEVHVEPEALNLVPVTFNYQWIVNGVPVVGETKRTFDPSRLRLGDRVSVDLIPIAAGEQGVPFRVEEGMIRNSLPVVRTIVIEPNNPHIGTLLKARAEVVDADQNLVHLTYRWRCNDQLVKEGDEATLSLTGFRVGDRIVAEAIPEDLEGAGQTVSSEAVIIKNSPPTVLAPPPPLANLDRYEYTVQAMDPDGDPLRFGLDAAPLGMTIDERSGRLVWVIPPGTRGTHSAKIVVEDDHGGSVIQGIELVLSPSAES